MFTVLERDIITDLRQLRKLTLSQICNMASIGWIFTINDGVIVLAIRQR